MRGSIDEAEECIKKTIQLCESWWTGMPKGSSKVKVDHNYHLMGKQQWDSEF